MRSALPLLLALAAVGHAYTCVVPNLVEGSTLNFGVRAITAYGTSSFGNYSSRTFSFAKYVSTAVSVWATRTRVFPPEGSATWRGSSRLFDFKRDSTLMASTYLSAIDLAATPGSTYTYTVAGKVSSTHVMDTSAVVGAAMTTDYRGFLSSSSTGFGAYGTHTIDLDASDGSIFALASDSKSIDKYTRVSGLYGRTSTSVTMTGNGIVGVSGYDATLDGTAAFTSLRISSDGTSMLVTTQLPSSSTSVIRVRAYKKVAGSWTAYAILTQTGGVDWADASRVLATPDHRVLITDYDGSSSYLVRTRSGADWSTAYSAYTFAKKPANTVSATYLLGTCHLRNAYVSPEGDYVSCPAIALEGNNQYTIAMHAISSSGFWSASSVSNLYVAISPATYASYSALDKYPSVMIGSVTYDSGMNTAALVMYLDIFDGSTETSLPGPATLLVARRASASLTWTLAFASTDFASYTMPNLLTGALFYRPLSIALSGDGRMLAVLGDSSMGVSSTLVNELYPASVNDAGPVGQSVALYEVASLTKVERRWIAPIYTGIAPSSYSGKALVYNSILRALPSGDQFMVLGTDTTAMVGYASIVGPHLPTARARVPSAAAAYDGVSTDAFQFAAQDPADGRIYAVSGSTSAASAVYVLTRVQNQLLIHAAETITKTSHGASYATGASDSGGLFRAIAFSEDGTVMAIGIRTPAGNVAARMYTKTVCGRWVLTGLLSCATGVAGSGCFSPYDRLLLSGSGDVAVRISSTSTNHRVWRKTGTGWVTSSAVVGPTMAPPSNSLNPFGAAIAYDGSRFVVAGGTGSTVVLLQTKYSGSTWGAATSTDVYSSAATTDAVTGLSANSNLTLVAMVGKASAAGTSYLCVLAYNGGTSGWNAPVCTTQTYSQGEFFVGVAVQPYVDDSIWYIAVLDSTPSVRIYSWNGAGIGSVKTVSISGTMDASAGTYGAAFYNSITFASNGVELFVTLKRSSGLYSVVAV